MTDPRSPHGPSPDSGDSPPAADPALRRKADAVYRARTAGLPEPFEASLPEAAQSLVHELRVHQIELEMQNEELRRTQVELSATRARYFDLFDLAPVGYLIVRESGLILQANLTAAAMLGKVRGALTDRPVSRSIFKADQDTWYLCRKRLVDTGEPQSCELRVVKPDGPHLWVRVAMSAACADDGTPLHRVTLTDIGESKLAEERLRSGEQRFSDLVNFTDGIVWEADATTFVFNSVSGNVERLLGYHVADWLQPGFWADHIHPDDRDRAVHNCTASTVRGEDHDFEYRFTAADGRTVWLRDIVRIVKEDNQPRLRRGLMVDITAQKAKDEALRCNQALLLAITENTSDAVFVKDTQGRYLLFNSAASHFVGKSVADVLGRDDTALFPLEAAARVMAGDRQILASGSTQTIEETDLHTQIGAVTFLTTKGPIRNAQGEITGLFGIARDITARKQTEDALRESEEHLRAIIDNEPECVKLLDRDGKLLEMNPAGLRMIEADDLEQVRGVRVCSLLAPVGQCAFDQLVAATFRGEHGSLVFEMQGLKGTWRTLETHSVPMWDADHREVRALLGVTRDITEQKRAENALLVSEARARAVINSSPVPMALNDDAQRITFLNIAFTRTFGYELADIPTLADWWPKAYPDPAYRQWVAEAWQAELTRSAQTGTAFVAIDVTIRCKDGTDRFVEANTAMLADTFAGTHLVVLHDITDRKGAEAGLMMLHRAIQVVNQGIVITDPNLRDNPIVYVSPGFERMTGYASAEVVGRNCRLLQGKDTDVTEVARIAGAFRGGLSHSGDVLNYRKDGSTFWNELSITPVRDPDGRLVHFVGIQTDVTARRSLEDQLRQAHKMEAVGQLAGGVAHDFNNLLTVINGYGDLLLSELPKGDPHREFVAAISDAGERAARLTRQLLAFSHKTILAPQVLDLREMVENSAMLLRPLIGEDIVLAVISDPAPVRVSIDPGQLDQVIMNLVLNARDAMPNGGNLTVEAKTVELDEEYARLHPDVTLGKYVLMSVSDSGSGMTPEVKARLFEPFFTTKGVGKGTGLGLAVVMGIVKQSGGHVAVYSELDHGTTIKLYFPAVEEQADTTTGHSDVAAVRGTETVLLVEDEDGIRGLALMVLQSHGYKVLSARDSQEALRLVAKHQGPIQLLLTDVVMPGMGGRELADALQPRYPQMKVLYTSGYNNDAVVRHGIVEAEVAFLQKPYSLKTLASTVRHVLDQK